MQFERVPARDALKTSAKSPASKWPARADSPRLDPFVMPTIKPSFSLAEGEPIFTIGSCFARHIEQALRAQAFMVPALGFQVPVEELWSGTTMKSGILNKYTPQSMLNEVKFAFGESDGREFLLPAADGLFLDAQLHTNVPVSEERALDRRTQVRRLYRNAIQSCRVIIITLGLVEAWWDATSQVYTNETPSKDILDINGERLFFEVLSPDVVIDAVTELLVLLRQHGREDQKVLLTVSPVPIGRSYSGSDAITANCYSKSALRVAAEIASRRFSWVDYYPSYESITQSNRASVWQDDQIHVRKEAVAANVSRMVKEYTS